MHRLPITIIKEELSEATILQTLTLSMILLLFFIHHKYLYNTTKPVLLNSMHVTILNNL